MFIYCICTQYLVGAPFALITASIRRGMEVISLWHCWGGVKPSFIWQWPSAHLHFLVSCFSWKAGQQKEAWSAPTFLGKRVQWRWFSKNTMDQHQQMTLHPNHHRLWKLNTGLQATYAMSFSTLPPDSRTLVSKWNTKLALIWKEDFGPLGNSPVLLLSPGKTTSEDNCSQIPRHVCVWCSWCLDPRLSSFLVKFTQILGCTLGWLCIFFFHSTFC